MFSFRLGDRCPSVRPVCILPRARVHHRLYGEAVPLLHDELGLVVGVVRDVGRAMEELADTMAAVRLVHLDIYVEEMGRLRYGRNGM